MKIIITENKLEKVLKDKGTEKTIKLLGGWENFCNVFNIESPMDFLHLFDNLEQVQSKANADWTLFRHKKGHNFMIYDRKIDKVYINYDEIWSFLSGKFGLNYTKIQSLTQDWLDETHNLTGVTTTARLLFDAARLDETHNLTGVTTGIFNDVQNISLNEVYNLK